MERSRQQVGVVLERPDKNHRPPGSGAVLLEAEGIPEFDDSRGRAAADKDQRVVLPRIARLLDDLPCLVPEARRLETGG